MSSLHLQRQRMFAVKEGRKDEPGENLLGEQKLSDLLDLVALLSEELRRPLVRLVDHLANLRV